MGFMYAEAKRAPKKPSASRPKDIPIQSLNKLGCSVCPRDTAQDLLTPKMEPEGTELPLIYLLGTAPNLDEDESGRRWVDKAGRKITEQFGNRIMDRDVRSGGITQCMPKLDTSGKRDKAGPVQDVEIECCRGRVVSDIEQSRPLVVVGVGDAALHWATGLPRNAMAWRGSLIATKIGRHPCWYYPLLYPNFVHRDSYSKSEYELTLEHDVDGLLRIIDDLESPTVYEAPFDKGISYITGQEPGDFQRLEDALNRLLSTVKRPGIDLETTALDPYVRDPRILMAAVGSFEDTVAFAIDDPDGWGSEAQMRRVRGLFGEYIAQSGRKVAHNVGFEQLWLGFFYGWSLIRRTEWEDTMAMCSTLDGRASTNGLDEQTRKNFGFFLKDQSRVDVRAAKWWTLHSMKDKLRYNGMDTKWCHKLADVLLPEIDANPAYRAVYEHRLEMAPTLSMITDKGLPLDLKEAQRLKDGYDKRLDELDAKIRRTPEVRTYISRFGSFDPGNPAHVLKLMKNVLERPEIVQVDNRSGVESESTGEEVLAAMPASEVPSAAMILEHRGLSRNNTGYLVPVLSGTRGSYDGRSHASYSSMKAVTGRLSSEEHNWPKRKYREVRGVVAVQPDEWFLACDYGQIEFRVAGMLSEDRNLVKYCWTAYDVHKYWAERMVQEYPKIKDYIVEAFGVDWDEKGLKTLRQEAKNGWVFPQIFGSAVKSCAEQLHMPLDVMEDLAAEFWDEFAGVKRWQESLIKFYEKNLYVETLGGLRRRGPMTKNEVINMPIQGTAAEIVTEAMNRLSVISIEEEDSDYQCNFNGHDDLSFIIKDDQLDAKLPRIVREMCMPRFDYINVPLVVEASVGTRWNQLKEIGVYRSDVLFNTPNPYK